jgi:hypothetical protein
MSRDGRGRPGRIVLKNQPRLRLADVLRRRRSTLKALVGELGVSTYAGLEIWCARMGLVPPTDDEFSVIFPSKVNSPQEGVIVLTPPPVIAEPTGQPIDVEPIKEPETVEEPTEPSQKKRRGRKDGLPSDD